MTTYHFFLRRWCTVLTLGTMDQINNRSINADHLCMLILLLSKRYASLFVHLFCPLHGKHKHGYPKYLTMHASSNDLTRPCEPYAHACPAACGQWNTVMNCVFYHPFAWEYLLVMGLTYSQWAHPRRTSCYRMPMLRTCRCSVCQWHTSLQMLPFQHGSNLCRDKAYNRRMITTMC